MAFKTPKWAATPTRANRFAKLEVRKDGARIDTIALGTNACTVLGRRADVCDYEMAHPSISRQHAALVHDKDGYINVVDLGSAQGTFVNGSEIQPETPVALSDGDEIRFGASSRVFVLVNPRVTAADTSNSNSNTIPDDVLAAALPTHFGAGSLQRKVTAPPLTTSSSSNALNAQTTAADARQQRTAEIAALTAQMLAAPAQARLSPPTLSTPTPTTTNDSNDNKSDPQDNYEVEHDDNSEDDDANDDDAQDDVAMRYKVPATHQVELAGHAKAIACLAIDPPGGRVATGSMDYYVKLWDFAGMARSVKPFRQIEVDDGHPLVAVSYSPSGDRLLAATGSSQPKILSREGVEELQCAKGDMYVVDMAHTNGHTHATTSGMYHPTLRDEFITSSLDGTVRRWRLDGKQTFQKLINAEVIKFKSKRGRRVAVTTCRYSFDGSLITGATMDGSVQCFDPRKLYAGAAWTIRDAHAEASGDLGISSIRFSPDGRVLATRSCVDDSVKLWDVRKLVAPLKTFRGIEGVSGTANVAFNGAGTCLVAGTSVQRGRHARGAVLFLDVHTPATDEPLIQIPMPHDDESAVCVEWHAGIHQVAVGTSSGAVRVLYQPGMSTKGVLLTATTKRKVQRTDSGARIDGLGDVHNPHALPMYRDDNGVGGGGRGGGRNGGSKRKFPGGDTTAKAKAKAPEKPASGPGMGGKIRGSSTFTQYFMSSHIKSSFREEDPREAILKYAQQAKDAPQFVAPVAGTIDKRYALATETLEQERISKEEEAQRLLPH